MNSHKLTWLKVKQKHIGTEPGIIKHQEQKWSEKARQARERAGLTAKKESLWLLRLKADYEAKFLDMMNMVQTEEAKQKLLERSAHYLNRLQTLYTHRRDIVRPEARATNIAYGYLRGRQYFEVENTVIDNNFAITAHSPSDGRKKLWKRVFEIVSYFGDEDLEVATKNVKEWRRNHPQYREMNLDDLS